MSDLRARLANALRDEPIDPTDDMGGGYRLTQADAENIADALLSLPGITITELPEYVEYADGVALEHIDESVRHLYETRRTP